MGGDGRAQAMSSTNAVSCLDQALPDEADLTAYSPASSLGWLDFDAVAADRVATLLRALQEPSTLDTLGLGPIVSTFSEMLHPGTSYVHTKLRYLVFLPWIFQRLEADGVAPGDFFRRLREDEALLIDCLRHLGRGQGVIGYQAGRNLKRMPSSIYWGALWDWGILRHPLTLGEYARSGVALGGHRAARDDDGNLTDTTQSMWAPLPPPPENFLEANIGFDLRPEEAQVLVESIRRKPETLLSSLCSKPLVAAGCTYPWDIPESDLPGEVAETLRHARCFSELTAGPQYTYNILVARQAREELGRDTDQVEQSQLGQLQDWVELVESRRSELRPWVDDLPAFWELVDGSRRSPVNHGTRAFITKVVNMAVDHPEGFEDDPNIHQRISDREIQLKGKRARLGSRAALENWHNSPVGGQHSYRWSVAQGYLGEIATALRTGA